MILLGFFSSTTSALLFDLNATNFLISSSTTLPSLSLPKTLFISTPTSLANFLARKFAREVGVDINKVLGSERDGRVVEEDIKKFVALRSNNNAEVVEEKKPSKIKNEFEHSDFGQIEIKDIPRVKKLSSKYLTNSWTTIPHVTNHDEASS